MAGRAEDLDALVDRLAQRLCNWDRWGRDDELGTLNLVTPAKRLEGAAAVREGTAFSLGFELRPDKPQPAGSGRINLQHYMTEVGADTSPDPEVTAGSDDVIAMAVHGATHWDALSHIFHRDQMYGGVSAAEVTSRGARRNDIRGVARRMATRGVLADVARHQSVEALPVSHPITADQLQDVLDSQEVELRPGDALLVRTGHLGRVSAAGDWSAFAQTGPLTPDEPGIDLSCLPLLHELGVSAVACDNWAVENLAIGPPRLPLHEVSLVYMGMILGEIFELDTLAAACAVDHRYDFLLAAAPLPIHGGVGGPVNPIAIR